MLQPARGATDRDRAGLAVLDARCRVARPWHPAVLHAHGVQVDDRHVATQCRLADLQCVGERQVDSGDAGRLVARQDLGRPQRVQRLGCDRLVVRLVLLAPRRRIGRDRDRTILQRVDQVVVGDGLTVHPVLAEAQIDIEERGAGQHHFVLVDPLSVVEGRGLHQPRVVGVGRRRDCSAARGSEHHGKCHPEQSPGYSRHE